MKDAQTILRKEEFVLNMGQRLRRRHADTKDVQTKRRVEGSVLNTGGRFVTRMYTCKNKYKRLNEIYLLAEPSLLAVNRTCTRADKSLPLSNYLLIHILVPIMFQAHTTTYFLSG